MAPLSNNANFYKARGIASYHSGDFLQAIASFNGAILLDPRDAELYIIRGNAWDDMGAFESDLADYDEAIRINSNNAAVFHDRAIMWQHKGELDEALVDLDRAIRFSFSDARMYCDRGLVWYEKGHHDRAIADFNQAIKLDPSSAAACIKRGLILHRNSEFKLTLATVNQAIRVDPSIFAPAVEGTQLVGQPSGHTLPVPAGRKRDGRMRRRRFYAPVMPRAVRCCVKFAGARSCSPSVPAPLATSAVEDAAAMKHRLSIHFALWPISSTSPAGIPVLPNGNNFQINGVPSLTPTFPCASPPYS